MRANLISQHTYYICTWIGDDVCMRAFLRCRVYARGFAAICAHIMQKMKNWTRNFKTNNFFRVP